MLAAWDLDQQGVKIIGTTPAALTLFGLPEIEGTRVRSFIDRCLARALLGLLEAFALATVIAAQQLINAELWPDFTAVVGRASSTIGR